MSHPSYPPTLDWDERIYHRDQLRAARYAALADAEGFHSVCYALEALGLRLLGQKADLGKYESPLRDLSRESVVLTEMSQISAGLFGKFDSLFDLVRSARNDAMHTGVYARHATAAAIALCIGLEEALMKETLWPRHLVEDFMVRSPVTVEKWQPVAHARQLMLMHSFSFLPVYLGAWKLLSEGAMAHYMFSGGEWKNLLSATIEHAAAHGLELVDATIVGLKQEVRELLVDRQDSPTPRLWLVEDERKRLCGVLSPFELM
ncbi:MAG TPA: hypothetical protein VFW68_10805 [Rhodocyclaceae bacterium]|nr:hypothetical protein [Rhodocyclaceae bacterium]